MNVSREWIEQHAPKPPSDCPRCQGERELDDGAVVCRFCGYTEATAND